MNLLMEDVLSLTKVHLVQWLWSAVSRNQMDSASIVQMDLEESMENVKEESNSVWNTTKMDYARFVSLITH